MCSMCLCGEKIYTQPMRTIQKIKGVCLLVCITGTLAAQTEPAAKDTIIINREAVKGVPVSGKIVDAATKKAVAGVRVQVPEFSATITDDNGSFTIQVPSYDATIVVNGEGYDTREVPLKGRNNISVALLDESHVSVHETVILPQGQQPKSHVTASV